MESILRFIFVVSVLLFDRHLIVNTFRISSVSKDNLFPLSIIHINDFHAKYSCFILKCFLIIYNQLNTHFLFEKWNNCRFEEFNFIGSTCKANETCIGGYARAVTVIKELKETRLNPIYLNAGDNFQGSLWYTLGGWNVTSYFLNMLNADAIVSFYDLN